MLAFKKKDKHTNQIFGKFVRKTLDEFLNPIFSHKNNTSKNISASEVNHSTNSQKKKDKKKTRSRKSQQESWHVLGSS